MINILYSGNFKIFEGLLTSVLSIVQNTTEPINVYVLTMDLHEVDPSFQPITVKQIDYIKGVVKAKNEMSDCKLYDMTAHYKADKNISIGKRFTPYALLRLYACKIGDLPDKILYLDVDTIAVKDISELYSINVEHYELMAVRDFMGSKLIKRGYFNSGVLLLNIKKIRETKLFDRVRQMCIEKNLFLADQSALNKCVRYKKLLPSKYNEQRKFHRDTVIRHYCAMFKFFPYIHVKNIKQWELEKVKRDRRKIYKNDKVNEIMNEYLKHKEVLKKEIM